MVVAAAHGRLSVPTTEGVLEAVTGLLPSIAEGAAERDRARRLPRAEIDAVLDYNVAQHRLLAALGHPASK